MIRTLWLVQLSVKKLTTNARIIADPRAKLTSLLKLYLKALAFDFIWAGFIVRFTTECLFLNLLARTPARVLGHSISHPEN